MAPSMASSTGRTCSFRGALFLAAALFVTLKALWLLTGAATSRLPDYNVSEELRSLATSVLVPPPRPEVAYNLTEHGPSSPYASQFGQDKLIDHIIRNLTNGFFVECGAQNGDHLSNSLYFELARGWTGLLVEANTKAFEQLQSKHRKAHLLKGALTIHPGQATREKFLVPQKNGISSLADIPPQGLQFQKVKGDRYEVEVQAIPLEAALSVLGVRTVHYFSLDVEGAELEVLKALPWDMVDIWLMTVEMVHAHGEEGAKLISAFMESKGFEEVERLRIDSVFARRDKIEDGTLLIENRGKPLGDFLFR